jgi:hypothetical protein
VVSKILIAMTLGFAASGVTLADGAPQSYDDAKAVWVRNRGTPEYQNYAAEFSQFNNHYHLDEKNGCYALAPGPVNLMLVISRPENSEFAVIEQVFADVGNAKARCFERSYRGVRTKIPPFLPFVLQMSMG